MVLTAPSNAEAILARLTAIGVNYRLADATTRSRFNISRLDRDLLLEAAKNQGIRSLVILSTCNRTEIYAYCIHENELINLLIRYSNGCHELFKQAGFIKKGQEALQHLFYVASGLDSQITGDFEILGQIKNAVLLSRRFGMIGPIMDRTINLALQASKEVRTNTRLSAGTTSVSYAAVEWMKNIPGIDSKKILLFGTGKFGRTLAKNIRAYFPLTSLSIINRTDQTAQELAEELSIPWKKFDLLEDEVRSADIIIVCTNASEYTLHPKFFSTQKRQWIIDLSVPENVHPAIKRNPAITVMGIDEISVVMKGTLEKRKREIPKAIKIVEKYCESFYAWLQLQKHLPLINQMKGKLFQLGEIHFHDAAVDDTVLNSRVNKTLGSLAMNLRYKTEKGCHYINAINDFLKPAP